MNTIDYRYQSLLQDILDNGIRKQTRNGETLSVFGRQIRHKMSDGFPLLTTKKMAWKSIVTELLWFLRGDTNIKYLVDNDCHIWDGDAYQGYLKRFRGGLEPATKERFIEMIKNNEESRVNANGWFIGELGPIYGKQWRSWETYQQSPYDTLRYNKKHPSIDQIANLISELKTNPDSRRLMVNAWNVGELDQMVLPPCHYGFQVYTRELSLEERKQIFEDRGYVCDVWPFNGNWDGEYDGFGIPRRAISLMWNQRSVDTFLGLPFNIASYGLLLEIIAKEVNMVPDELIGNLGDVHIYANHIEQAKEQIGRELTHIERIEKLFETNKDAKSLLSQEKPEVICSLLLDKLKVPKRTREPFELPKLKIKSTLFEFGKPDPNKLELEYYSHSNFELENYQSHPAIKAPLSN